MREGVARRGIGPFVVAVLVTACPLRGQLIYSPTPNWQSADTQVSTGGALVDIDLDGWLDFVVANGNDILRQELVVYYNKGDGTLPATPDWLSDDQEFNGHISVADVNGDGWPDVAVGLTMAHPGTATARLYLNNEGTLSSLPDWEAADEVAAFHVAFGDVNGDGRPDLAVGTGWPYSGGLPWHNHIYVNVNGTLESTPSWASDDSLDFGDIFFCDANGDGWLDLIGVGEGTDTWAYVNDEGTLATAASWHTTDNPDQFSLMGTYGDVDGDGRLDLFTTDNIQEPSRRGYPGNDEPPGATGLHDLRGSGYVRRYDGLADGLFTATPTWTYFEGFGSAVALADLDADGDLDLLTGSWWGQTHYFLNTDGVFPSAPSWTSQLSSVVEAICLGDVNNDGLEPTTESFDVTSTPGRHLFQLAHQPIERIESVAVDDIPLGPDEFTFDAVRGWVSVGPAPSALVTVDYIYTIGTDMAVTNWDGDRGNYLYYHRDPTCLLADPPGAEVAHVAANRYISFTPANPGRLTALRVTLADLPAPFSIFNGIKMWVGEPREISENAGKTTPLPHPSFMNANLQCEPYCMDFGSVGVLHVTNDEIVPGAVYDVQAIDCDCEVDNEGDYSTPARITTSIWGDVVGTCAVIPCTPPNGVVGIPTDVTAVLDKFKNLEGAPIKARCDIEPARPDLLVNITDVMFVLDAFRGFDYPFEPGPAPCSP